MTEHATDMSYQEPKGRGLVKDLFGQFATRAFWKDMFKTLVQEAVTTFLMALGGTLVWYGRQRRNKDVASATGSVGESEMAKKAFGGEFSPSPSFRPSTAFPVPTNPTGDARFPGFR